MQEFQVSNHIDCSSSSYPLNLIDLISSCIKDNYVD